MNLETYAYSIVGFKRYKFISIGKKQIVKLVQFKPTTEKNIVNLGFGDQLPNGNIDDKSISDNGDILKVFATVIRIAYDFSTRFPSLKIIFTGSTPERTNLYNRILRMYYTEFSKDFFITAFIEKRETIFEVDFDPENSIGYTAFLIKRKS